MFKKAQLMQKTTHFHLGSKHQDWTLSSEFLKRSHLGMYRFISGLLNMFVWNLLKEKLFFIVLFSWESVRI